jgi:phenylacetate-CoA ligase
MPSGLPLLRIATLWRQSINDRARLEALRAERLGALCDVAMRHVPAYRDRVALPATWRTDRMAPERFATLPVLDKDTLRREGNRLIDERCDPARLVAHRTSGSTGVAVTIWRTWQEERLLGLLRLRYQSLWGFRPQQRRAWLVPGQFNRQRAPVRDRLTRHGPWRLQTFDCFAPPAEVVDGLLRYRPQLLTGYPEVIANLADYLRGRADAGTAVSLMPRWISCGGDTVTADARARIRAGFPGSLLGENYGSTECNLIAWECLDTGLLHVCDDGVHVELLDEGGAPVAEGAEGRVVVTPLHSAAMPLLRLDLGDLAVRGPTPCPCGLAVSTLQRVSGRRLPPLRLGDGSSLHPFELLNIVVTWPDRAWLRRYRLVQTAPSHLELQVLPDGTPSEQHRRALEAALRPIVAGRATIEVVLVAALPADANGKSPLAIPWRPTGASPAGA